MPRIYHVGGVRPQLLASEQNKQHTIKGVQIRAVTIYAYICVYLYMCHNSSACHIYIMWVELGHCHFVGAISNA